MIEISKDFWNDLRWGEEHHSEFLRDYKDKWIAILNKKIVSYGENLEEVKKEAHKKTGKTQVPVIFIDCGEHIYYV